MLGQNGSIGGFSVCVWWHPQENISRGWIMGRKWKSKNRIERKSRTTRLSTPPAPLTVLIAVFTFTSPFTRAASPSFLPLCLSSSSFPSFLCPFSVQLSSLPVPSHVFLGCYFSPLVSRYWRLKVQACFNVSVGMHFALELSCVKLEMFKPSLMTLNVFILCTSTHMSECCISQMQQVRQK